MEKIIIDTCIFIDIFRGNRELFEYINVFDSIINPIIFMELIQGSKNKIEVEKISKYLRKFEMEYIDKNISLKSMELIHRYSGSCGLKIPDAIIASHSIVNNHSLFTLNKKDYKFIEEINIVEVKP